MYDGRMWIELHCHSTHSDGSRPAEEVAARAAERGVELFCLTDHDSCAGYAATVGACRHVLRGLELSCNDDGRTVHLLVYDVTGDDARWAALDRRLAAMRRSRRERIREIGHRLRAVGVHLDVEAILADAGERSVGRPDVAQAMVAAGVVGSLGEAFERFLGDGKVGHVPVGRLSVRDGLAMGRDAGARMSLAHPHTLGDRASDLLQRHRDAGLEGLECFYGTYNSRQRRRWLGLARRLDLVVTGGSDFHGLALPQVKEPGIFLPEVRIERLLRWLEL